MRRIYIYIYILFYVPVHLITKCNQTTGPFIPFRIETVEQRRREARRVGEFIIEILFQRPELITG